ncbi:MAG: D-alanine--D-alanine ligase [Candidatus Zambryskibacteria bacterium]
MKKKIKVGILFGGKSAEHEVSLQSAKNVADAIDKNKYDVALIGIDKNGKWLLPNKSQFLLNANNPKLIKLNKASEQSVALVPQSEGELTNLSNQTSNSSVDVVFPILHGPFGEDGTVQGLLKLAGVPFVGASVLGSAIGMDKDVMKRLLRDAGIPVADFLAFRQRDKINFEEITKKLGLPFFVKPANLGSSVGINKVKNKKGFSKAIKEAFRYDTKIIIEEFIDGRELECSVLGNQNPIASAVGEVIPHHEFYSYDAKYIDENGATLEIPAKISSGAVKSIQKLAVKTFKILSCEGLGRVDFFLRKNGQIIVNEINTIPGFTKISMYPRLWGASGISYKNLIDRLIVLAIERFKQEQKLKTSH